MKRIALVLITALALGRPEFASQDPTKAAQTPIRHEVTVTLKLVQVYVTDSEGKPALNLEKSDFALYDNGKIQSITDFEKHALKASAAEHERMEVTSTPTLPPARNVAPLLNRKFIFLIDYARNELEGIMKAKAAALEFMDTKVGPDDEVALFSISVMGGLMLHEYLTSDHDKLRTAIRKLRDVPGITPVGDESLSPDHVPMGMELINAQIFGPHAGLGSVGRRSLFSEVAEWTKALRAVPGQKNIIFFSRGFGKAVVLPGSPDNLPFEKMTRELASANARVFTVNTTTGVADKIALGVFPEDSLDHLSRTTGGKYFPDINYYSQVARDIQDSTANYYVLGFVVAAAWDGKYHDIKVEVRRPGYKVYAQRGYFNPLPFNKLSPIEKHLHLLDIALGETAASKRNLDFPMTAIPFTAPGEVNVLLLSELPVSSIREAIGDRTEFISLIFDHNNSLADGKRVEIDWKDFRAEHVYQYASVALAQGYYDCRTVIRNLDDGRAAVGACSVEVTEPRAEGPMLFPPLFLVRGPEAPYLNITVQAKGKAAEDSSISGIFPFPAKEYVPLVGPPGQEQNSLYAVVRYVGKGVLAGELELSAWISAEGREEKTEVEMSLINNYSREGTDCFLLEFELPELFPGRCRLEIHAADKATGVTTQTAGWFSLKPPA